MADEQTQVTEHKTTEVIGLDAQPLGETTKTLSSIFDKMEGAKAEGRPVEDALKEDTKEEVVKEEKNEKEVKQEVKEEKKEQKTEEKTVPDDPREVLKQAMKDRAERKTKTEEKAPDKVETKENKEKSDDDVPENELQVLPYDKPRTAKRIQALLKKIENVTGEATKTKAEAEERATKLADLEKKLAEVKTVDPTTDERVKTQLDELAMLRRRYQLDSDPEVKSRFDGRIESAEASIVQTLKKHGATDALLGIIKEEGGWNTFCTSARKINVPDGSGGQKGITASELAEMVVNGIPFGDRKAVEAAALEQYQLRRDKDHFVKEEQSKANKYFQEQEENGKKQVETQKQQVDAANKEIESWRSKFETSDLFKNKDVPSNATPDQKAEVEEYNKYNSQLKGVLKKYMTAGDLPSMLEVVQDAVSYWAERRTSSALKRENDQLKEQLAARTNEITKFKKAGSAVSRSGSISTSPSTDNNRQTKKAASLEDAFDAIGRGERPDGTSQSDE